MYVYPSPKKVQDQLYIAAGTLGALLALFLILVLWLSMEVSALKRQVRRIKRENNYQKIVQEAKHNDEQVVYRRRSAGNAEIGNKRWAYTNAAGPSNPMNPINRTGYMSHLSVDELKRQMGQSTRPQTLPPGAHYFGEPNYDQQTNQARRSGAYRPHLGNLGY